jgi:DNA-binding MarR family transcriptional regulator
MTGKDPFVNVLKQWIEVLMRRSMRNFIHYAREKGLSMSQINALFYLSRQGCSGVTDLGDHLGVTSGAASQMLERLVQMGLILRSEDPNDRRVKQIVLTDAGRLVLQEGIRARQGWLDDLAGRLTPEEKSQVMAALKILIDKASQPEEPVNSEKFTT